MSTVAEQLRAAREAKNLSVEQIAEITKMRSDHVRALEEGNYGAFSAPVYIRGFVRTYSRLLKLDELADSATLVHRMRQVQGLFGHLKALGVTDRAPSAVLASAAEFILEGLYAQKRISRSEEVGFFAEAKPKAPVSAEPHRLPPDVRRRYN